MSQHEVLACPNQTWYKPYVPAVSIEQRSRLQGGDMGSWIDLQADIEYTWEEPVLDVTITDNPVTNELVDHNGNTIRQWTERPPVGFR